MSELLVVTGSPHIHTRDTTERAFWRVTAALLPAFACALYAFGIGALIVTALAATGCVVTEFIIARYLMGRQAPFVSMSALLTGSRWNRALPGQKGGRPSVPFISCG